MNTDKWFKICFNFHCGFALAKASNEKWCLLNKEGKPIGGMFFKKAFPFYINGKRRRKTVLGMSFGINNQTTKSLELDYARVQREDGLWGFLGKDGKILDNKWFHSVSDFQDGKAKVRLREEDEWLYIDSEGFLTQKKFSICEREI